MREINKNSHFRRTNLPLSHFSSKVFKKSLPPQVTTPQFTKGSICKKSLTICQQVQYRDQVCKLVWVLLGHLLWTNLQIWSLYLQIMFRIFFFLHFDPSASWGVAACRGSDFLEILGEKWLYGKRIIYPLYAP